MELYDSPNCTGNVVDTEVTNADGDATFAGLAPGNYSVKETLQAGWQATTETCQNVTLVAGATVTLDFGNQQVPGVGVCETWPNPSLTGDLGTWTATGLWHVVDEDTKAEACPNYLNVTPFPSSDYDAWYGQDATCNYNTGGVNSGSLISPAIPVTPGPWNITFDSYLSVEPLASFDLARVYYSFTGPAGPWTQLWTKQPPYNSWEHITGLNITVPAGTTQMWLKFDFNTVDSVLNNYLGWEVDNICVNPGTYGQGLSAPVPLVVSEVLAIPNPVKDVHTMTFLAEGQGIAGLEVEVFDLAGKRVFSSSAKGNKLDWHLQSNEGSLVANGVYLYVVTVKGYDGTEVKSEIKKLVVLR